MRCASPAAGLIRRTLDMTRLLGSALDRAEMLGDEASHFRVGHTLTALRDAMTQDVFPTVLELDDDTALVELRPAVISGMRRRGILRRLDEWTFVDSVCDRAPYGRAEAADLEDAADRLVLIEARARDYISRRLITGQAG